jgi:predicted nucleic acid-binding protein
VEETFRKHIAVFRFALHCVLRWASHAIASARWSTRSTGLKGREEIRTRLESEELSAIRLSGIVLGELEFGPEKSAYGEHNRARLETLARRVLLVGVDRDTTRRYGRIRALLEGQGTPIGAR